jgi:hypothetical protein
MVVIDVATTRERQQTERRAKKAKHEQPKILPNPMADIKI